MPDHLDAHTVATFNAYGISSARLHRALTAQPLPPHVLENWARLSRNLNEAMASVTKVFTDFAAAVAPAVRKLAAVLETIRERANDPVRVAGLEGRYMVRAGLDPAYATADQLDALVRSIMRTDEDGLAFLTRENRALIAAAAIRGWSRYHGVDNPAGIAWGRLLGSTTVLVTREVA